MRLQDKVCLVTGAGSGIGKRTAVLMARQGARVAALSRTPAEIEETVREIERAGGEGLALETDITEPEQMQRSVGTLIDRWGRLDVLFANAGINGVWAALEELRLDEWTQTLSVNLTGTFLTLKHCVPYLKRQGGSVIVNASVNGTRVFSNTGASAYAASKAGQVALAKMAALELARFGIRVNVVCPGAIETEIAEHTEKRATEALGVPVEFPEGWHPLRREPGTAEQVARLVLFLASEDANHITGSEIWIDGGESLIGIRD